MLAVTTEFRKGVFFVRLKGRIDNEGYLKDIDNIINTIGIHLIVLNINCIQELSLDSIKQINNYNKRILKKKKLLYICDKNMKRNKLFNLIPRLNNEIEAFSLI